MRKIFFTLLLMVAFSGLCAQERVEFPYTFGMHTYLMGERGKEYFDECRDHGIKYIEVQPEGYGSGSHEQILEGCKDVIRQIEDAGLTVWSVHLPYGASFDISVADEAQRKQVVAELSKYIRALADAYNPVNMVLHPSNEPITTGDARAENIVQAIKSVGELNGVCREKGVTLCVENLPRTCLGNTPEELLSIVTPTEGVKVCFDTNHYLKGTYDEFIRKVGHLVGTVHFSDYDYTNEKHWLPGMGVLPWGDVIMMLKEYGYNGVMMSESDKGREGWTNPVETSKAFEAIVKEYDAIKDNPAARTALFLKGMKDRYWPDSTPEAVFVKGDAPGQYPKQLVGDFLRRYHRAEAAVKQATATADEFQVMREQLSEQCAQLVKSPNKVSEGIYRIVSAHEGFAAQGKKIAMYSDESKTLKWKELEPTANFLFEIKEVGDGEYSIRNMGTDTYIHTLSERYTAVPMSGTHGVNQCIEFLGKDGMVKICNKENSTGYHSAGHNEGAGAAGDIVVWDSSPIVGSGTAWRLEKVSPIK